MRLWGRKIQFCHHFFLSPFIKTANFAARRSVTVQNYTCNKFLWTTESGLPLAEPFLTATHLVEKLRCRPAEVLDCLLTIFSCCLICHLLPCLTKYLLVGLFTYSLSNKSTHSSPNYPTGHFLPGLFTCRTQTTNQHPHSLRTLGFSDANCIAGISCLPCTIKKR